VRGHYSCGTTNAGEQVKKRREAVPTSAAATAVDDLPDAVLLDRFARARDARAFAVLVQRFGSVVLGVCRRVLRHEQDAEDAFQATFLVLARKAGSIHKRESVGSWLYGVAYRIAGKVRGRNVRRRARERELTDVAQPVAAAPVLMDELRDLLDGEVNRLPLKYRRPFVLYYVQGKSKEQVAEQLQCRLGTVASRLGRARERLRTRLTRRGVTITATALAAVLGETMAAAALPSAVAESTAQAALSFVGASTATAAATSATAAALARNYAKGLIRKRLEKLAAALLALGAIALVLLLLRSKPEPTAPVLKDELDGTWKVDQFTFNGQEFPAGDLRMAFGGGTWRLLSEQGQALSASYRSDATKGPKAVDLILQPGRTWPGIYTIEGDRLKLCYNTGDDVRPTSFDTRPTDGTRPTAKILSYILHRETGGP